MLFLTQTVYAECERLDKAFIQKILHDSRIEYQIPALAVSINCPHEKISHDFVSGTMANDSTIPIHSNNLFQMGSVTKPFIAVILLKLEAENILSIDDPIQKWLPSLPLHWRQVTIKQLLNHSSGIYNYTDTFDELVKTTKNFDFYKKWSAEELINFAVIKPLHFEPGEGWQYSNTNYVLAGMIIEAATAKSLRQVLHERIFIPLDMNHSYYLPEFDAEFLKKMVRGYSVREYFPDEPKDVTDFDLSWGNAAGGIISTAHDLSLFLRALVSGALLLPKQMEELMTTVPINGSLSFTTPEAGYGLGLIHDRSSLGEENWYHSGGTLGYSSYLAWLKEEDIVIAVTLSHVSKNRDMYEITKRLAENLRKTGFNRKC